MNSFYLSSKVLISVTIAAILVGPIFDFNFLYFFILLLVILIFLQFRKTKTIQITESQESFYLKNRQVLSPVNGIVKEIEKIKIDENNCEYKIRIYIPFFMDMGLFLPASCEVLEYKMSKGASLNRFSGKIEDTKKYSEIDLDLKIYQDIQIELRIIKCQIGLIPEIWLTGGDRGKIATNFGMIPFGGTVIMKFKGNWKLNIENGDQLLAGQSKIASHVK
jgi:hypothetical protein